MNLYYQENRKLFMKGVSEVIVIVLILMITAAMASLAFMFFSDTASSVSSTTSSVADSAAQALSTSMTIDGIAANAVYVKNTGKNDLKDFAIFINDAQTLNFTNDHPTLRPGETAIIRIYNYLVEGDKITVSTPSGYQYAYADPCKSAVLCLKLDNMTGSSVYDSSPQHVNGTIYTRRENRIRYSQDYSNGAWSGYCGTKNNTIYNTTDVAAPDGTYTATKWTIDPVITCPEAAEEFCSTQVRLSSTEHTIQLACG
jgi:archaellum component FlaG (FlaF/FlaG flagellin family)